MWGRVIGPTDRSIPHCEPAWSHRRRPRRQPFLVSVSLVLPVITITDFKLELEDRVRLLESELVDVMEQLRLERESLRELRAKHATLQEGMRHLLE